MSVKNKNYAAVILLLGFIFGFALWGIMKPDTKTSEAERRTLAEKPTLSVSTLWSGNYMSRFESYVNDQFPMRDEFRALKAFTAFNIFQNKDVNGIYVAEGYASKLEYPMNVSSIENADKKFRYLYDRYLKDANTNVFLSVIPDKNYFLASENGYPTMDYAAFVSALREKTDAYMQYIDIFDTLAIEDYYRTDTHWRQERLEETAARIADALDADINDAYYRAALDKPFRGVYYGQSALPLPSETLYYLESDTLSACRVFDYESNKYISVYDLEKGMGRDAYEIFLSGSKSLLRVENPKAENDRCLILFRDSFGGSIAPLLVPGYSEIILVDIRYLASSMLGNMIDFENADVLFLYSTMVLNNSETLK